MNFMFHLESLMCKQKFEIKFFEKDPIQLPNGVHSIHKIPFLNGSYRNGVGKALWAMIDWKHNFSQTYVKSQKGACKIFLHLYRAARCTAAVHLSSVEASPV